MLRNGNKNRIDTAGGGRASRRKLLKGAALAAPAVFTLPSNAAALAFGSFAQCVRNTTDQPEALHIDATDAYARQSIQGIYVRKTGGTYPTGYDPNNPDMHVLVRYGSSLYVDEANRPWTKYNGYYYDSNRAKHEPFDQGERYTVAFVDDDGNVLGVHPKYRNYGRAVSGSCWISLLPQG